MTFSWIQNLLNYFKKLTFKLNITMLNNFFLVWLEQIFLSHLESHLKISPARTGRASIELGSLFSLFFQWCFNQFSAVRVVKMYFQLSQAASLRQRGRETDWASESRAFVLSHNGQIYKCVSAYKLLGIFSRFSKNEIVFCLKRFVLKQWRWNRSWNRRQIGLKKTVENLWKQLIHQLTWDIFEKL